MDDQDTPVNAEAKSPAKRTRKAAAAPRRARSPSAEISVDDAVKAAAVAFQAVGGDEPAPTASAKPPRTRRAKPGAGSDAAVPSLPGLGSDSNDRVDTSKPHPPAAPLDHPASFDSAATASSTPAQQRPDESTEVPFFASFSPEDPLPQDSDYQNEPATDAPRPRESLSAHDEDLGGPATSSTDSPTLLSSAPADRPVFVPGQGPRAMDADPDPSLAADANDSSSAELPLNSGAGGALSGAREEKKTWWERKKEKKRLKWLERQQGGASPSAGTAPSGSQAPAPYPASGADRGPRPDPRARDRERAAPQPPPPGLQSATEGLPSSAHFNDASALDSLAEELAKDQEPLDLSAIHGSAAGDLATRLRGLGETIVGMPSRRTLVDHLFAWAARKKRAFRETGLLDLADAGHGFIVHRCNSYRLSPESTFVPPALVKRYALRRGQELEVLVLPPQSGERCPAAVQIYRVMGTSPELAREVTAFEELIPYYPTSRILVEATSIHKDISMRAVDLLTPIGFGQRGLIVAPPRTGKTVLMQNIANSISHNYPAAILILLLIDERPEEVTDFKRNTKGEVVSSTFDESPESHVHASEMVIERARRLVEMGKDVVILLDSVTRLARAYNALAGNGGKTMSGGLESNALQRPKRFFGSARNIEGGGSLTILGTALVDTNSRMDEVIFEEFKGTGNMELHLDRGLSDKRIFPAINIDRSGTRKEELIYHPDEMLRVYGLRRAMQGIPPVEAMDMFIQRLKKTRTNTEFLLSLNR